MNLLHTIGLMTRAEHERIVEQKDDEAFTAWNKTITERNQWMAKFKRAAAGLAAEVQERKAAQYDLARARLEIADLRPDAEAMRKKRAADRKRMAGKRNG